MSWRVNRLTPKSAAILVACLLLVAWAVPKWVARYQAISQLREDGFLYFDHGLRNQAGVTNLRISKETVAAIAFLQPRMVTIKGCSTLRNLDFLVPLKSAQLVDISDCPALEDIGGIRNLVSADTIIMTDCSSLHSMDVFSGLHGVWVLSLEGCSNLRDFSALQQMPSLYSLTLGDCTMLTTLDQLPALKNLRTLNLRRCKHLRDVRGITRFLAMDDLDLTDCTDLQDIRPLLDARTLRSMSLSGCINVPPAQIRALRAALPPDASLFFPKPDR